MPANTTIKIRKGTESEWQSSNPILASGEPGYAIDTNRFKIGDGSSNWNSLSYASVVPSGFLAGSGININLGTNGSNATISVSGLNSSYISDFNSSVSGLLPVKDIVPGTGVAISSATGVYTINVTGSGVVSDQAVSLVTTVFNHTGSIIPKMTAVYINGGQGDMPTVGLAIATGDMTSAGTYGLTYSAINNMDIGQVIVFGALTGLNTDPAHGGIAGATEGSVVYLSPSVSGGLTTTKPYAPDHIVTIGTVVRVHQNEGVIEVRINNGFELEELHNVATTGATNGQFLQYNSATGLWVPSSSGNFTSLTINSTGVSLNGHTHVTSDITNFASGVADEVNTTLSAGTGISLDYDSGTDTLTISATGLINNPADNRLLTSRDSTTIAIDAENNLTFDGNLLNVTGSGAFSSNLILSNQTASTIASFDASKNITSLSTVTYPSLTELSYVKGVTSALQTQLSSKQNTLTNPVTGTGTINYLPLWSSTSGLTNSVISQSSNTITIGRQDSSSEGAELRLARASDNSAMWIVDVVGTGSTPKMRIYDTVSLTERLTILGGGTVGIGNANPSTLYKLDVTGTGNFSQNLLVNGTGVSLTGHTHTSSSITDFNSSVSGLLPTIANSGDNRVLTSTGSTVGINAESSLTFDGQNLSAPYLLATYASGDEGGEIQLTKPPNGTLSGGITIDAYQNKLRFFEQGGSARGFYLDISSGGAGVSTNLAGGGGSVVDYQEFTSNNTWTKPAGCTFFYVEAIGAGGGGGGGRRGATSTSRNGGGGGAGGTLAYRWGLLSQVSGTVSVTVGVGGGGGNSATADSTSGGTGTQGGDSQFGSYLYAPGGGGGAGGTDTTATAGSARVQGNTTFGAGFSSSGGTGAPSSITANDGFVAPYGAGGGGGGGGINSSNFTARSGFGGAGFLVNKSISIVTVGGGGARVLQNSNAAGGNGTTSGDGGGGGGPGQATSAGGAGGTGASPGGGGGGGGGSTNGYNSGAGGSGANGIVRIWCW